MYIKTFQHLIVVLCQIGVTKLWRWEPQQRRWLSCSVHSCSVFDCPLNFADASNFMVLPILCCSPQLRAQHTILGHP